MFIYKKLNFQFKETLINITYMNRPWVNKYRPKNIKDIIYQDEIVMMFKNTLKTGNLPHLLLYGPPGCGKTSFGLVMAYQLFGPNIMNNRVMELNASDERGISVVRNKIYNFARTAISNPDPKFPCPPYKIIILDEADAMTTEAQAALRKIMEELSGSTRFIFMCNYINQIIDPICSRCMKFRFKPIRHDILEKKITDIATNEKMNLKSEIISTIVNISKGDARKAIMTLQNLKYVYKPIIEKQDIYNITCYIPEEIIKPIWDKILLKEDLSSIMTDTNNLFKNSYSLTSIMEQLQELVIHSDISDYMKGQICIQMGNTEKRLSEGSDERVQLINIFSYIHGTICETISFISKNIC